MPPLLLASTSPRRRDLLREAGIEFEVAAAKVTELSAASSPHLSPVQLAEANAQIKARAVSSGRWVLGADTVVALDRRIFGKPASLDEAHEFLRLLGGRTHEVITGCALVGPEGREVVFHDVTRVTFRSLNDETITRYLDVVPVLDKAGAYGLQEKGEWLVERVEGSASNVIGLPMEKLLPVLREFGIGPR